MVGRSETTGHESRDPHRGRQARAAPTPASPCARSSSPSSAASSARAAHCRRAWRDGEEARAAGDEAAVARRGPLRRCGQAAMRCTGIPSWRALSTRFSVMPLPGKAMTPLGRRLSSSSLLRAGRRPGAGTGPADRGRAADRRRARPCPRLEIRRSFSALPASANLRAFRPRSGSLDAGRLGRQGLVPSEARCRPAGPAPETILKVVHGRDAGACARSGPRQDQNRLAVGIGPGRPSLGRRRSARRGLLLRSRARRRACRAFPRRLFDGILQVDGYAGYNRLTGPHRAGGAPLRLAYCWSHCRRRLR